jgi:hypothetical protein
VWVSLCLLSMCLLACSSSKTVAPPDDAGAPDAGTDASQSSCNGSFGGDLMGTFTCQIEHTQVSGQPERILWAVFGPFGAGSNVQTPKQDLLFYVDAQSNKALAAGTFAITDFETVDIEVADSSAELFAASYSVSPPFSQGTVDLVLSAVGPPVTSSSASPVVTDTHGTLNATLPENGGTKSATVQITF